MKRLFAIVFLLLILLNTFGYYAALRLIETTILQQATSKVQGTEHMINGNLLLQIPMLLPYAQNDEAYYDTHGKVEIEGDIYLLIKQKYYNGTMLIVGMKDEQATKIKHTITDFSKSFSDQHPENKTAGKQLLLSFTNVYLPGKLNNPCTAREYTTIVSATLVVNLYAFTSQNPIFRPPC